MYFVNEKDQIYFPVEFIKKYGYRLNGLIVDFYFRTRDLSRHQIKELLLNDIIEEILYSPEDAVKFLKSKKAQIYEKEEDFPDLKKCAWCFGDSFVLHEHHYPICKKEKGKNIVNVCPNCHCEYHFLIAKKFFKIKKEIALAFEEVKNEKPFLKRIAKE